MFATYLNQSIHWRYLLKEMIGFRKDICYGYWLLLNVMELMLGTLFILMATCKFISKTLGETGRALSLTVYFRTIIASRIDVSDNDLCKMASIFTLRYPREIWLRVSCLRVLIQWGYEKVPKKLAFSLQGVNSTLYMQWYIHFIWNIPFGVSIDTI